MTDRLHAVFAIPGDMHRRTGGFIYESTVLAQLRALGHTVTHLQLPDSFPQPSAADIAQTVALLRGVPAHVPVLLDGFIPGCLGAHCLAAIAAPLVPIIHHPLYLETGLSPERTSFLRESERAALGLAARIVGPSPHTARMLTARFGVEAARIDVAPPGFQAVDAARQPVDPPLILSIGILAPRKGHDVLVDALSRLGDLNWQAQIVGGIHDHAVAASLRAQVQRLGLSPRVTFRGALSGAEVRAAYAQASIFALATRYEGYGMVFGEAMQRGLPIVTCRAGAVPDTVGDAALLVAVDDAAAFAAALRTLLTQPESYSGLAIRAAQKGRGLPSWRDTALRIAQTLKTVLGAAQASPFNR